MWLTSDVDGGNYVPPHGRLLSSLVRQHVHLTSSHLTDHHPDLALTYPDRVHVYVQTDEAADGGLLKRAKRSHAPERSNVGVEGRVKTGSCILYPCGDPRTCFFVPACAQSSVASLSGHTR